MYVLSKILIFYLFFFNDTATTEIYTLSLHDALPISRQNTCGACSGEEPTAGSYAAVCSNASSSRRRSLISSRSFAAYSKRSSRSEEHTSELQSPCNLVCRLLLEKKKNDFIISFIMDH